MTKYFIASILISLSVQFTSASAKVNVFACEPEWAALAAEIGGKHVSVFSATHAKQNPHYIRARPSLISKARRAQLMICHGASLEAGWLPILLQRATQIVQPGSVGHLMASDFVPLIEIPVSSVDRSMGDIHPEGNPHTHLNPYNVLIMAKELNKRLQIIDKANKDSYDRYLGDFVERWKEAIEKWEKDSESLKQKSVVVHHKSFSYLLDWLKINQVASMEPKPGIPPTVSHLEVVLQILNKQPADVIIRTPYEPNNASEWLSQRTGSPAIVLPYTVGGEPDIDNLFKLFDRSIALLKASAGAK